MRAMVLRGSDLLKVEDVPDPRPGPGQVLAFVRASGVCGSDVHFSKYADDLARGGFFSRIDLSRGVVLGHEFAAEIAELGPGVEGWKVGDRVTGAATGAYSSEAPGAYGERVVMNVAGLHRVPDGVSDRVAALTEPGAVGLHAVREAAMRPGEKAVVMGAGPIGLLTALWLRHDGHEVAVSDPAPARRDLAERLGVPTVLDPSDAGFRSKLAAFGAPAVVFECVGVAGTLQEAIEMAPWRGRVVVVGVCMVPDTVRVDMAVMKHLTIQCIFAYTPTDVADSLDGLARGAIDAGPIVTRTVGLDELPEAFLSLNDPSECKVMLELPR